MALAAFLLSEDPHTHHNTRPSIDYPAGASLRAAQHLRRDYASGRSSRTNLRTREPISRDSIDTRRGRNGPQLLSYGFLHLGQLNNFAWYGVTRKERRESKNDTLLAQRWDTAFSFFMGHRQQWHGHGVGRERVCVCVINWLNRT